MYNKKFVAEHGFTASLVPVLPLWFEKNIPVNSNWKFMTQIYKGLETGKET